MKYLNCLKILFLFLACSLSLGISQTYALNSQVLTIAYTANTYGKVKPCPSWGSKSIGGLARRASIFTRIRNKENYQNKLFLAGGYEFHRPGSTNLANTKTLLKVFSILNYDLGILSPHLSANPNNLENKQDPKWLQPRKTVQTKILNYPGEKKVGILIFPEINTKNNRRKIKRIHEEIVNKAQDIQSQVNLLLGMSTWGIFEEEKFLNKNPAVLDIFLGSGPGPHKTGKFLHNNKTVWIRPLSKGKAISQITISHWPEKDNKQAWKANKNISCDLMVLKDSIPADPEITSQLQ